MNHTPKRAYPWQRRRRQVLLLVASLGVFVVFPLIAYRWTASDRIREAFESARAAKLPMSVKDLATWAPAQAAKEDSEGTEAAAVAENPPGADTASPAIPQSPPPLPGGVQVPGKTLAAAIPALYRLLSLPLETPEEMDSLRNLKKEPGTRRLEETERETLRKLLAGRQEAMRAVHEVSHRPPGRFPIDLSRGRNPDSSHVKAVAEVLRYLDYEARLEGEDGNTDKAAEALLTGFRVADTMRNEPVIYSHIFYCRCVANLAEALGHVLSRCTPADAQLAKLSTAFAKAETPQTLTNALITEQAMGISLYDDPEFQRQITEGMHMPLDDYVPGATTLLMQGMGSLGRNDLDKARYVRMMSGVIEASRHPAHEMTARVDGMIRGPWASQHWLPRPSDSLASAPWMIRAYAELLTTVRAGVIASAMERYRLVGGFTPEYLDGLIPAFLDSIPLDPFDGKPLRFRRENADYLVYGIGINRTDDNGKSGDGPHRRTGDIVLRVEH